MILECKMTKGLGVLRELAERSLFPSVPQASPGVHRRGNPGFEGRPCLSVCTGLMGVKGCVESPWGRVAEGMGMRWLRRAGALVRMSRGGIRHVAPCGSPWSSAVFLGRQTAIDTHVDFTKRTQNGPNQTQQQGAVPWLAGKTARSAVRSFSEGEVPRLEALTEDHF